MTEPYYSDEYVTLFHGDCREIATDARITETVGAVVADPPYGETTLPWDRWPEGWVQAVGSTLPDPVPLWCFGSMRMFLMRSGDFAGWTMAQDLVWEKPNGSGFAADRFKRVHEFALQWYRGPWSDVWSDPVRVDGGMETNRSVRRRTSIGHTGEIGPTPYVDDGSRLQRSVIRVASCHGEGLHPTQKPLGILDPLIRFSCPPLLACARSVLWVRLHAIGRP